MASVAPGGVLLMSPGSGKGYSAPPALLDRSMRSETGSVAPGGGFGAGGTGVAICRRPLQSQRLAGVEVEELGAEQVLVAGA